jgi:hypothetical protein
MAMRSKKSRIKRSRREKATRRLRRELNLCTRCGRNKPLPDRRMCGRCGEKNLEHLAANRARHYTRKSLGPQAQARIDARTRSQAIFDQALRGETFGPHPGYVGLWIRPIVYNALNQRMQLLPGKDIELLVGSVEEVDEAVMVINRALTDWINGVAWRPYE